MEGQKVKEESDDNNYAKAFDFAVERKKQGSQVRKRGK